MLDILLRQTLFSSISQALRSTVHGVTCEGISVKAQCPNIQCSEFRLECLYLVAHTHAQPTGHRGGGPAKNSCAEPRCASRFGSGRFDELSQTNSHSNVCNVSYLSV